jgi:hypothetical protein
MEPHGMLWNTLEYCRTLWKVMEGEKNMMERCGTFWKVMEL